MAADDFRRIGEQVKGSWTRHQFALTAMLLTLLGAGLRLYNIDANGFNTDEVFSIWQARFNVYDIVRLAFQTGDATPPLYHLLQHAILLVGQSPLLVRASSVVAGTLSVWLTFRLADFLFDVRVATLSAFLMAVSPLHVAYSRLARAYALSGLWALFSLYFFAQLFFHKPHLRHWVGLVAMTAVAIWTFYLTFPVALFENVVTACLLLRRRLSRTMLVKWIGSQLALGILLLPALLYMFTKAAQSQRQSWLLRPGLQALVKGVILFGTGDPSYGPIGITPARVFSLVTIAAVGALGLWVFLQRGYHRSLDEEGRRVLFVACAFIFPWATALVVSQVRPIYTEKYFTFVMPLLFILFAWVLTRAPQRVITSLILLSLLSLTGAALFVYYTEPFGEQWREAVGYVDTHLQSDDLVVISPGFYGRPFAFYSYHEFPGDWQVLSDVPDLVVESGQFRALSLSPGPDGIRADDIALASARRIWFLSGYSAADPMVVKWIEQTFEALEVRQFVGARVCLLQRMQSPGTEAGGAGE